VRHLAPVGEAVEERFDDALLAPEGEDGHFQFGFFFSIVD